ncbi:MAG TPA: hypothetical protein VGD74_00580, partial [Vulgatibacter sp.]
LRAGGEALVRARALQMSLQVSSSFAEVTAAEAAALDRARTLVRAFTRHVIGKPLRSERFLTDMGLEP